MRKLLSVVVGLLLAATAVAGPTIKSIQAGATDQTVVLKIIDSTDGTPATGVVFNTSGIDLEYWRHGPNAATDITEATQTVNGAHTDGGFVHIGHGMYRLDLPDAAVAAGATAVEVYGTVTGMIVIGGTVELSPPVTVATNNDKTGYSLTQTFPANFSDLSITATTGRVDIASVAGTAQTANDNGADINTLITRVGTPSDLGGGTATLAGNTADILARGNAAWTTGAGGTGLTALADGTAQGGTSSTIQLASAETFGDDILNGAVVNILTGTGAGQTRVILDYVGSTDTATVSPNWTTNPASDSTYEVVQGSVNLTAWLSAAPTALETAATIRAEIDANSSRLAEIVADTSELQTDDVPGLISGLNNLSQAQAQTAAQAALNAYDPPTNAELVARTLPTASYFDPATDPVANVTLVATTTTNTDMRGTDNALLASSAPANFGDLDIEATTGHVDVGFWNGAEISTALSQPADIANAVLDAIVDGTIDVRCALALTIAYSANPWNQSGSVVNYRNPGDTVNRITGTIGATSFSTVTHNCP